MKDRVKLSSPQTLRFFPPPLNANVFWFFESHRIYDQTRGFSVVFFTLYIVILYLSLMTRPFCKVL